MRRLLAQPWVLPLAAFAGGMILYISTLAPSIVFGDPAEYVFGPYVWGILHPPGYAVYTLLAKAWQTLVPLGSVAYRTNLLAATVGAVLLLLVAVTVQALDLPSRTGRGAPAAFAAAVLATAPDVWQHAIHANAHILTAALVALVIACLARWRARQDDRWLAAAAFAAGLSAAHHPLALFSFPAYAAFVLSARPALLRDWRALLRLAVLGLLGLAPLLYFPIRASLQPPVYGPADANTLDGFLNLVLARGLKVNLFHFGLDQQWQRVIVLWSLLRLQFSRILLALIGLGMIALWRRDWRGGLLLTVFLGVNLAFILNTVQDVMAYLLVPLVGFAVLAGEGARWIARILPRNAALALLILPLWSGVHLHPRVSLRDYRAADAFVESLSARFEGRGERAALLVDWEHWTPLQYHRWVEGRTFDPADLTPVFVSGGERPWVENVWQHIEAGPIYVLEYQPQIVAEGFRLRADGELYRVVPPAASDAPDIASPSSLVAGDRIELLGFELEDTRARAGDAIRLTLFMRAAEPLQEIVFPSARLGPYHYQWTTDSHLLTPYWQPGEVVAERFDLRLPLDAPAGELPLLLSFSNLSTGEALSFDDGQAEAPLASIDVQPNSAAPKPRDLDALLANFDQRVGLVSAGAWVGGRWHPAPWSQPIEVQPGQPIHLLLCWRGLAPTEASATVFLHLLDSGNALWAGHDYTPLGGAFPTMLWFPKWLEGNTALDPYTLVVPADSPPGEYYLEVGLYGLRSVQRWPVFDREGNMAGDRVVVGGVVVSST